jgi:hypothetical protein
MFRFLLSDRRAGQSITERNVMPLSVFGCIAKILPAGIRRYQSLTNGSRFRNFALFRHVD